MRTLVFSLLVLAGCTKAGEPSDTGPSPNRPPAVAPIPVKTAPKPQTATRVELTAVTLADDCGGAAPAGGPAAGASAKRARGDMAREQRRCEQTSMQLAIIADGAASLRVKSVELFDETGTSLGTLTASKPTRWSETNAMYEAWDEAFAAGSRSNVSYVLTQPNWAPVGNRWNKTFTLKAVLTIDGVDQTAQKDVTLTAPTSLPPNVRT